MYRLAEKCIAQIGVFTPFLPDPHLTEIVGVQKFPVTFFSLYFSFHMGQIQLVTPHKTYFEFATGCEQ